MLAANALWAALVRVLRISLATWPMPLVNVARLGCRCWGAIDGVTS